MSRLEITAPDKAQLVIEGLYKDLERRIESSPPGLCPVDMTRAFLEMCHTHTCGKCVPCRVGLWQLKNLLTDVMNGDATMETLDLMEELSVSIMEGADCAIGYEAAHMVYKSLMGCREDYEEHVRQGRCTCQYTQPVPCVSLCPAHVDIPGYIALVGEGRYADAIRLIRKDNPFPTTCGFICEHPCEARCRRNIVDDAVNIRGLKRMAADYAGKVPPPPCAPSTGKRIAVVGGGPGGLSAAYYLQLMGHQTTVFEMLPELGGMLRYGIPNYRLPKDRLNDDINAILETGVKVEFGKRIGKDMTIQSLREEYDAVLITIGASTDKKLGIEGEHSEGVLSAVQFLRDVGKNQNPDLTGQEVAVIGGHGIAVQGPVIGRRVDGTGGVGGNDGVGIPGHFVQGVGLDQIHQLVVRKQEHVCGSGGVFQITGLAVHSAHGAVFKGVFLLRMLGGKFVAKLFRQLQLALIRPDLQGDLFLFAAHHGGFGLRLCILHSGRSSLSRSAGTSRQHTSGHQYCHQQRNDLLHNSLLLHNYLTNGFLPLPLSLYRLHKNWSTKI